MGSRWGLYKGHKAHLDVVHGEADVGFCAYRFKLLGGLVCQDVSRYRGGRGISRRVKGVPGGGRAQGGARGGRGGLARLDVSNTRLIQAG